MKRLMLSVIAVTGLLAALASTGCAHAEAKAVARMPPLDVPLPPPRSVEPNGTEVPQPVGLIVEPPRNTPPQPRVTAPAGPAQPRTEAPRVSAPAPADTPKAADDPARTPAAPTLQTTPAQQGAEVEARIRAVLTHAASDLNRIDYARLNANARNQYDSAKRFVSLSEDALRTKNLVYAGTLADKAAELAAQLAGR